jgi:hypothetical protein
MSNPERVLGVFIPGGVGGVGDDGVSVPGALGVRDWKLGDKNHGAPITDKINHLTNYCFFDYCVTC